jgi:hypothetical protein
MLDVACLKLGREENEGFIIGFVKHDIANLKGVKELNCGGW